MVLLLTVVWVSLWFLYENKLIKELAKLEEKLQREINYKLYTLKEFKKEVEEKEPFILGILRDKRVIVIGDENEL